MSEAPLPEYSDRRERVRYNREKAALRRRSDAELVADLQLQASLPLVDGREEAWVMIERRVSSYTLRTLPAMIVDGRAWAGYRKLGRPAARDLVMPVRPIDAEDARDLAAGTVPPALPHLRRQLLAGRWDPTGGAALTTWFNNLCIMFLPGPWRAWRREHSMLSRRVELDPERFVDPSTRPDAVIYEIEFERYVEILDDDLADLVRLDADGFTDAEIAQAVGRTSKSVEYRLAKARESSRRRRDQEQRLDQLRDVGGRSA